MRRFLLALLLVVLAGLGVWWVLARSTRKSGRKGAGATIPAVTRSNPEAPRVLGSFQRLAGTSFVMADIHSGNSRSYSSGLNFSSGGTLAWAVHNYIFLDLADRSCRRLVNTNDALFSGAEAITADGVYARIGEQHADTPAVRWLLFRVFKLDTNHDGRIDSDDLSTLALSDPGGRGYTELIGGIQSLYGRELSNSDTLVVVYESGGMKQVSVVNLPGRAVTSTSALPDLGPDVP
jgi:hypothetical protein